MYAETPPPRYSRFQTYYPNDYDDQSSPTSSLGSVDFQWQRYRGDVSTAVKALLLATKQLQDSLGRWAVGQLSETQISDLYVQFGSEFNATILAFAWYGIDMSEVHSIPKQLRQVLELCLGEDPSPRTLSRYMPEIRRILYSLLEGLRAKQPRWKAVGSSLVSSNSQRRKS